MTYLGRDIGIEILIDRPIVGKVDILPARIIEVALIGSLREEVSLLESPSEIEIHQRLLSGNFILNRLRLFNTSGDTTTGFRGDSRQGTDSTTDAATNANCRLLSVLCLLTT